MGYKFFIESGSLIVANITKNPDHYLWEDADIIGLNEAIWLSDEKKYIEAKNILLPLLNQAKPEYQSKISELYGDILSVSSGSVDDIIKVYERSYSYENIPRVMEKIQYFKNLAKKSESTQSGLLSSSTSTGSFDADMRKKELNQISTMRSKYLNNGPTIEESRSELMRLIQESADSWTPTIRQDW